MQPVKPAFALLKEVGEAGQHNDFAEVIGVRVITVAEGHDKSQPAGCLLDNKAAHRHTPVPQRHRPFL